MSLNTSTYIGGGFIGTLFCILIPSLFLSCVSDVKYIENMNKKINCGIATVVTQWVLLNIFMLLPLSYFIVGICAKIEDNKETDNKEIDTNTVILSIITIWWFIIFVFSIIFLIVDKESKHNTSCTVSLVISFVILLLAYLGVFLVGDGASLMQLATSQ